MARLWEDEEETEDKMTQDEPKMRLPCAVAHVRGKVCLRASGWV